MRGRPCSSVSFICQGMRPSLILMKGLRPWRPERGLFDGPGTSLITEMLGRPLGKWARNVTVIGLSSGAITS